MFHVSSLSNEDQKLIPEEKPYLEEKEDLCNALDNGFDYFQSKLNDKLYIDPIVNNTGWVKSKLITEAIFEYCRKKYFETMPSRLRSVYLFDDLNAAKKFCEKERKNEAKIFNVDVNKNECVCLDMQVYTDMYEKIESADILSKAMYEEVLNGAKKYWSSEKKEKRIIEFLYNNPITLGREVTD